jgi:hypothetical protein
LVFELYTISGVRFVSAFYVAQLLDDMRKAAGTSPVPTPVPISGCGTGTLCPLDDFAKRVEQALDPDCSQ